MIGIYKITNKVNGKIYIGQSITIKNRWKQHINEAKNNRNNAALYLAMRKYGIDNFSFEVIEECDIKFLNEREIYWINFYNSFEGEGYNMTPGGSEPVKADIQKIYSLWDKGYCVSEIVKEVNVGKTSIQNYLNEYENYSAEESNRRGGVKARQTSIQNGNVIIPDKCIKQYDLWGNYIKTWTTQNEIERELGIDAETIGRALRGEYIQTGGYQWFNEDSLGSPQDLTKMSNFKIKFGVDQYDLNGNKIKTYTSVTEAANALGCDKKNIARVCKHQNNRKTACGYKWEYNYNYWNGKLQK